MKIPSCNEVIANFCRDHIERTGEACYDLWREGGGKLVFFEVRDKICSCICGDPGLSVDEDGATTGHTVLAAGLDLDFKPCSVALVFPIREGLVPNVVYLKYGVGAEAAELVVRSEHRILVVTNGEKQLLPALHLQLDDRLVNARGAEVAIAGLDFGTFRGTLWEMAISMAAPDETYARHLIVTAGIVTGDLAVTTFATGAQVGSRPAIGTKRWLEANGASRLHSPVTLAGGTFTSGALYGIRIPDHASP